MPPEVCVRNTNYAAADHLAELVVASLDRGE